MTTSLVDTSVYWLNSFPTATGVSTTLSPANIILGRQKPNYNTKRIAFGKYAMVYAGTKNNMKGRSVPAIALRPSNEWGGHFFMSLLSGKQLHAYIFEELPINSEVISRVHELADQENQPELVNKQPVFQWSNGEVIGDINISMEDAQNINSENADSDSDLSMSDSDNSSDNNNSENLSISESDDESISESDNESDIDVLNLAESESDNEDDDFFVRERDETVAAIIEPEESEAHMNAELRLEAELEQLDRRHFSDEPEPTIGVKTEANETEMIEQQVEVIEERTLQQDTTQHTSTNNHDNAIPNDIEPVEQPRRSMRENRGQGVTRFVPDIGGKQYHDQRKVHRQFLQMRRLQRTKRHVLLTMLMRKINKKKDVVKV